MYLPFAVLQALEKNGVKARPGVSFGNLAIPPNTPPPAAAARSGGLTETEKIIIGVCVGAGGLLLLLLGLWCCKRQRKDSNKISKSDLDVITKRDVEAGAAVTDDAAATSDVNRKGKGDAATTSNRWAPAIGMTIGRKGVGSSPAAAAAAACQPSSQTSFPDHEWQVLAKLRH